MSIPGIITNNSVKFLSGLGSNSSSIIPMAAKDTISNAAIVHTYKKEGTKDDVREKAIEEFGTGIFWLFGIPAVKKIIDKTIYPLLKLDPELDPRVLKNASKINEALKNSTNDALKAQKDIFASLNDKNPVLKSFTNKDLYKSAFVAKFAASTLISLLALAKIISFKQKTTDERIKKDFARNNASVALVSYNSKDAKKLLSGKEKSSNDISFKGLGAAELFMYNPVANTTIMDGGITGLRIAKGRKGEKGEIAFKEFFQLVFIYGLAYPIQKLFEFAGNKIKAPIELDPVALFDKDLSKNLSDAKDTIEHLLSDKELFEDAKNLNISFSDKVKNFLCGDKTVKINGKILKDKDLLIAKLYKMDLNSPLIKLLDKNQVLPVLKDKNGEIEALSYIKNIDASSIIDSLNGFNNLLDNISNLKKAKAFKVFAVLGNILFCAWAMGVLQPKLNIALRKFLNNGDNRNQAIVEQEKELRKQASAKLQ